MRTIAGPDASNSNGSFHDPYDDSTVRPVTADTISSCSATEGWPGRTVRLTIDALDSDENHTVEAITWSLPEPTPVFSTGADWFRRHFAHPFGSGRLNKLSSAGSGRASPALQAPLKYAAKKYSE
jgi:hypothetical protein